MTGGKARAAQGSRAARRCDVVQAEAARRIDVPRDLDAVAAGGAVRRKLTGLRAKSGEYRKDGQRRETNLADLAARCVTGWVTSPLVCNLRVVHDRQILLRALAIATTCQQDRYQEESRADRHQLLLILSALKAILPMAIGPDESFRGPTDTDWASVITRTVPEAPDDLSRPRRLDWAKLLQRTFTVDVLLCPRRRGPLRPIAT
jgi:hypothetical protein